MSSTDDLVRFAAGAEDNGLCCMLSELLKENLKNSPIKKLDLKLLGLLGRRVGIVARDADVSLTLEFSGGRVTLHDGVLPDCDLVISTDAEKVTNLSLLDVKYGMPVFHDEKGRKVLADLLTGALKIDGLVKHPVALTLVTRLMSVSG
jgi:hypothetical protein